MLVDSHCHLNRLDLSSYGGDFKVFLQQTQAAGITHMLCVATSLSDYPAMQTQVIGCPQISTSVGDHPNVPLNPYQDWEQLQDILVALAKDQQNVGIGETGLDYYRTASSDIEWQQQRFRSHIRAAKAIGKPLIIHSRQAAQDVMRILHEEQAQDVGGVWHCFSEDWATAKEILNLGFYISFSGIITFPKTDALRTVAKQIPEEFILIETDSPYLAPVPYRGKPNEPKFVIAIAECIANIRATSTEALAETTGQNFWRLFSPKIRTQEQM